MPEQINPLKKFINSAIIAANTDLQTGDVRKPFANKPVKSFYEQSSASKKMGSKELGFGKELLENNRKRFLDKIEELSKEKGTWTKENIRKAEAIKLVLYNLPIIHYTSEGRLAGYGNDIYLGLSNLNNQGLLSGEKVTLNGGMALNSYQEDTDIDRHKYVYACLGQLYFVGGNLDNSTCAIFLNKDLLKQPSCLVQDQKFQKQLGLGNSSLNFNSDRKDLYQDTNQSSLVAADYVNLMAIGMATGVVDYNSTFPEIMFKDEVASSKIDYVLQPYSDNYTSSTKNNQADYEAFEDEISELENAKNDPKNKANTYKNSIYSKIIKAPRSLFYKLQDKSVLAPDTSFKSKPQPWYKKAVAAVSK